MKILVLTNLYPPHHAGTFENHCETVTDALRLRGHEMRVLTSMHGLRGEQRDPLVERRLVLNGVYGHPALTGVNEMKPVEVLNNTVLHETLAEFQPDVVHVFSLYGLSKSLIFTLTNSRIPVVYDVFDHWLSANVREDPWLRFWNAPSLPIMAQSARAGLEMSGERGRLDSSAPTRLRKGYDRLPGLFGSGKALASVEPNSIGGFRFDHIYFCSQALKSLTERVGFCVWNGAVIYPGIPSTYIGDIKPANAPMKKLLVLAKLSEESGVLTAMKAVKIARDAKLDVRLAIYGRGDSGYVAQLRSFAISNGLQVDFLNVSNKNAELPAVYRAHDVLLHTPEWNEPFPFTPLEAMGCGLPVIGSRAGAAEELLRHGENALTFSPGNVEELALRIQELLISPILRCQMAEAAQSEVLGKFNQAAVTDQIESFLDLARSRTE